MLDWLAMPESWAAFSALTLMELMLSIDNIVFLAVIVSRLPEQIQRRALFLGLLMALAFRLLLLTGFVQVSTLQLPLFSMFDHGWSWRDLLLLIGGGFLIAKAVHELHLQIEGGLPREDDLVSSKLIVAVVQIAAINLVFSIDSIITAFGMATELGVMAFAVVAGVLLMFFAAGPIADYVDRHPTTKTLALAFLLLIGFSLCLESAGVKVPKGYIYAAMAFAIFVEAANQLTRKGWQKPRKAKRPAHLAKQK
jgi:predicted tellurium resistance membrane protein TerC